MSDQRPPAFQHYPKDYLADPSTMVMTLEQEGAYRRLMDYIWLEGGSISAETSALAALCKTTQEHFEKAIWPALKPCFRITRAGRLRHARLDRERKKQVERKKRQREGGKSGASKRWKGKTADKPEPPPDKKIRGSPIGNPMGTPMASDSSPSPTPSPTPVDRAIQHPPNPPNAGQGTSARREDGYPIESEIERWLPTARQLIVKIHGSPDPVRIGRYKVGVGIEINRYRKLCRSGVAPPEIVAKAIGYLPDVTDLEAPVSLARWEADDGPGLLSECLGRAWESRGPKLLSDLVDATSFQFPHSRRGVQSSAPRNQLGRPSSGAK